MKSMFIIALISFSVCVSNTFALTQSKSKNDEIENVNDVVDVIQKHFQSLPNYQNGDLITTRQVEPLFGKFASKDWDVPNKDSVMARLTPTGSYLDQTMNSGNGRQFFRDISSYPGGIDRVERMSNLKNGRNSIGQLVNKTPRGSDFVKALATSKHGRILGNWTGKTNSGEAVNQPTGKIYTQKQLVDVFKQLFQESSIRKIKNSPKRSKRSTLRFFSSDQFVDDLSKSALAAIPSIRRIDEMQIKTGQLNSPMSAKGG